MNNKKSIYKLVDCGGECGGCVALVRDGVVIVGPPFHPHCGCGLTQSMIDAVEPHESNLNQDISPNKDCLGTDVKWLKNALNFLGFYRPDIRAGETEGNLNEYPNQNLFNAINEFQNKYKLDEHGVVKPGYQTEAKINQEIEHKTQEKIGSATFDKKTDAVSGQYATFDGKTLTIYQNNNPVMSWDAVSGNKDFQSPEYQNLKSKGPIPEGIYVARQEKLQYITPYGLVAGLVNKGTWPGGLYSWGNSRIALEASKETNTFDRGGFYVHGGWKPGSNGCIDLTSQMDDFTKWFENNGHDLIVNVKYE